MRRQIADGVRFVAGDPYLRVLTVFGAASNIGLTGYQALLVVFLVRDVGLRPALVGALFAVMGVGAVLGALVATGVGRRLGTARGLLLAGLLAGPPALLIPLTGAGPRLAWLVGGAGAVGLGVAMGNVIKGSFRQTYTPHHLLGRVTVSMQLLNYGTIPLGALLAGALGSAFGPRPALWLITGWLALTGFILLAGPIRHSRDLPAAPEAADGRTRTNRR